MSVPLTGPHHTRLTVTPFSRSTEDVQNLEPIKDLPPGVQVQSYPLKGTVDPTPHPNADTVPATAPAARFDLDAIAKTLQQAEGDARWSSIRTDSGVRGQLLEASDGRQYKVALPSGVLPEPIIIESNGKSVSAQSFDRKQTYQVSQGDTLQVSLPTGEIATFNPHTFAYGLSSPVQTISNDVRTETLPKEDEEFDFERTYQFGTTDTRTNIEETVQADGTRQIVADRHLTSSVSYRSESGTDARIQITDGPHGLRAQFLVTGHQRDKYATDRHPLNVTKNPDGSYVLHQAGWLKNAWYDLGNHLHHLGHGDEADFWLITEGVSDETVVRPFSAVPENQRTDR